MGRCVYPAIVGYKSPSANFDKDVNIKLKHRGGFWRHSGPRGPPVLEFDGIHE